MITIDNVTSKNNKNWEAFLAVNKSDNDEIIENIKCGKALSLLDKIIEDFACSNFTEEDIKRAYNINNSSHKKGCGQHHGISELNYLRKLNLLLYDPNTKEYTLNHASSHLAKRIMGGSLEDKY